MQFLTCICIKYEPFALSLILMFVLINLNLESELYNKDDVLKQNRAVELLVCKTNSRHTHTLRKRNQIFLGPFLHGSDDILHLGITGVSEHINHIPQSVPTIRG